MTINEKYDNVFIEKFSVKASELSTLKYQEVSGWDSVGHMELIAALEEVFDISLDTDDIIDFSSYEKGKEILKKYNISL